MITHFNFNVLIVLPKEVLSAASEEGQEWGRKTE
jgi:hypothetical protein